MHTVYDLIRFIYITKYEIFFSCIFFTHSCLLPFFCSIWRSIWIERLCKGIKRNENTIVARSRELIIKDTWNSIESDWSTWFVHCTLVQQHKIRLSMNKCYNHIKMIIYKYKNEYYSMEMMEFFVNKKRVMNDVIYLWIDYYYCYYCSQALDNSHILILIFEC